uniref:GPALPP motifs-containing protein 1 n=2 Tax=Schistocephalus solidus TaxID=70667 RepID=A0A0V0J8J5_SCHSO
MTDNDEAGKSARIIGPSLAPDAVAPASGIGPAMPEHLIRAHLAKGAEEDQQAEASGTKIDPFEIGPLLPGSEIFEELRHMQTSADTSQNKPTDQPAGLQREAWMTEYLPVSEKNMLRARKFCRNPGSEGVDVSWFASPSSETAAPSVPPPTSKMTAALDEAISVRDQQMSAIREAYNKTNKRDESLLDAHRQKLAKKLKKEEKKKKKKHSKEKRREKKSAHRKKRKHKDSSATSSSSSSPERRRGGAKGPTRQPFDRDRDLLASRVGFSAKRALIERSKQFSSKFAHGSQKFL